METPATARGPGTPHPRGIGGRPPRPDGTVAAELRSAEVRINGRVLLSGIDWRIGYGDHWAVLGRNGAGKSTLMSLLACLRHPSSGTVSVLGHRLGTVDLRDLRRSIGLVTTAQRLLDEEGANCLTVVLTGYSGTVQPMWREYDDRLRAKAADLLSSVGCAELTERSIRVCSQGERARVRVARALMADPAVLLLDEPFAGLDLPAREDLIEALERLARTRPDLTTVTVTHHLEEIPATTTHALLLRDGRIMAGGTPTEVLSDTHMSTCFGRPLRTHEREGRWSVQAGVREPRRPRKG
ncbi:ATP-binding cassette domain-containing protein [Streptomyces sp. NPDC047123]|uniref:ABC transporter ATP-binding protein n=1 Tax=Streptomyces sp. NPDC047123 TaxID=3155622 RepID=UPI003400A784